MTAASETAACTRQDADDTLAALRAGLSRAEVNAGVGQEHFAALTHPRARAGMGFSADTSDETACARFTQVYGCAPALIVRSGGCVWAGPLPRAS